MTQNPSNETPRPPADLYGFLRDKLFQLGPHHSLDEAARDLAEALIRAYGPIHLPLTERPDVKVLLEQRDIAREDAERAHTQAARESEAHLRKLLLAEEADRRKVERVLAAEVQAHQHTAGAVVNVTGERDALASDAGRLLELTPSGYITWRDDRGALVSREMAPTLARALGETGAPNPRVTLEDILHIVRDRWAEGTLSHEEALAKVSEALAGRETKRRRAEAARAQLRDTQSQV